MVGSSSAVKERKPQSKTFLIRRNTKVKFREAVVVHRRNTASISGPLVAGRVLVADAASSINSSFLNSWSVRRDAPMMRNE